MTKLSNAVKWFQSTDMKKSYLATKDCCISASKFYCGMCDRGMWMVIKDELDGKWLPSTVLQRDLNAKNKGLTIKKKLLGKDIVYPDVYEIMNHVLETVTKNNLMNGPLNFDSEEIKKIKKIDKEAFIQLNDLGIYTGIAEFSRALDIVTLDPRKKGVHMAICGTDWILLTDYHSLVLLNQYNQKRMQEYRKKPMRLHVYKKV